MYNNGNEKRVSGVCDMKKRTIKLLLIISTIFFLLALFAFNDVSLVFTGIGIILFSLAGRELIIDYWKHSDKK